MLNRFKLVFLCLIIVGISTFSIVEARQIQKSAPPSGSIIYSHINGPWSPESESSARYDLYLGLVPGSIHPVRLTSAKQFGEAVWYPSFSPDGSQILFKAELTPGHDHELDFRESPTHRNIGLDLVLYSISTKHTRAITKGGSGYGRTCWSPDGTRVAAVMTGWSPYDQILSIHAKSGKFIKLVKCSKEQNIDDLFWSRDGRKILYQYSQNPNLYAVSRAGGKRTILVKGKGSRTGYSFSPDGKHISFIQDNAVYMANADGSSARRIIKPSSKYGGITWLRPAWSRDGRRLATAEVTHDNSFLKYVTRIHAYDVTSRQDKITTAVLEDTTDVMWSRNNKWLVAKIRRSGNTERPDPITGWYAFYREGLMAVNVADGYTVTLKQPDEETKGLDWFESR